MVGPLNVKKMISNLLKFILPKNIYDNRRDHTIFILYNNLELFIKTLNLRIENKSYLLIPSKHIGAKYLLNMLKIIFNNKNKEFFLWDASLLGLARKQNAIAGSASDIDIAMIFNKRKDLKFLLSLKKYFKIKILNNYNSIQLFHKFGQVDITLFKSEGVNYEVYLLDSTKSISKLKLIKAGMGGFDLYDKFILKKLSFHKKNISPFKIKKLYSEKFFVPNKYLKIVKQTYGLKWKTPDKKKQVFFT